MDNKQLISRLARRASLDNKETTLTVSAAISVLTDMLASGNAVTIPSFGTFATSMTPEHVVIEAGKRVLMPPRIDITFIPGQILITRLQLSVTEPHAQPTDAATLTDVAQRLSTRLGYSQEFCERFVSEFFKTISYGLETESDVRVNSFGSFFITDLVIAFTPDKSMAQTINAPFDCFDPEPLAPTVTEAMLDSVAPLQQPQTVVTPEPESIPSHVTKPVVEPAPTTEPAAAHEPKPIVEPEPASEPQPIVEPEPASEPQPIVDPEPAPEPQPIVEPAAAPDPEPVVDSAPEPTPAPSPVEYDDDDDDYYYDDDTPRRRKLLPWLTFLLGLIIGVGGTFAYFTYCLKHSSHNYSSADNQPNTEQIVVTDAASDHPAQPSSQVIAEQPAQAATSLQPELTAEPTPTQPAKAAAPVVQPIAAVTDTPVTDTIHRKETLSTLSRRHYGDRGEFWVYIYEENASKIKDPNNVAIGTVLVIPPASKYGIDPNDEASIDRAKNEAHKVLKRK